MKGDLKVATDGDSCRTSVLVCVIAHVFASAKTWGAAPTQSHYHSARDRSAGDGM